MTRKNGTGKIGVQPYLWLFGLLLAANCFLLSSCFEPQEGCLDLDAENYDVAADDNCSDCCTYPSLNLTFRHLIGSSDLRDTNFIFQYNRLYRVPKSSVDSFFVQRIRFFLSDIRLVRPDGEEVRVLDSIEVEIDGVTTKIEDSFIKVDRDDVRAVEIGTIITNGDFSSVKFKFGLPAELLNIDPNSVSSESQLFVGNDSLIYKDTIDIGYRSGLIVYDDTPFELIGGDSTVVELLEISDDIEVVFPEVINLDPGFDLDLTIAIDYLTWFQDNGIINASTGVPPEPELTTLRDLFLENITQSFRFFEDE